MSRGFSKRGLTILVEGLAREEGLAMAATRERPARGARPEWSEWPPREDASTWEPWRRLMTAIARVGL
jgi:hypothetical protein